MTITIGGFLAIAAVLYAIGVPVSFALALGSLAYLISNGIPPAATITGIFGGIDNTTFLCVPFFLLTGNLMVKGGISDRLIYVARLIAGRLQGALCHVTILTGLFFASITGTTLACASAIGPMMIPEMEKDGYSRSFATAVTISGSTLGPIFPPSVGLVMYVTLAQTSLKRMFMVGISTGFILAFCMIAVVYIISKRKGYKPSPLPRWKELNDAEKSHRKKMIAGAMWAFGTPAIILGGIFSGVFTPTEAAVVSAVYSLFLSIVVYRQVKISQLPAIFVEAGSGTARTLFIIACASLFSWVLSYEKVPQKILINLLAVSNSPFFLWLIIFSVSLFMGLFLDPASLQMIMVPILVPMLRQYGMNIIHVGIVFISLITIGTLTPPFGTLLFAGSYIGQTSVESLMKEVFPFVFALIIGCLVIAIFPQLVMWII